MLLTLAIALTLSGSCSGDAIHISNCSYGGSIDHGGVTLDGSGSSPGGGGGVSVDVEGGYSPPDCSFTFADRCNQFYITSPGDTAAAPITLADIAHFAPVVGDHVTEPDGWAARGLPLNLVSTARAHVVDGSLLGAPASVRFTPVEWRWDHGDGTTAYRPTGGGTWHQLGLREFDDTATSHVFESTGRFTITLDIVFRAEYRIGSGSWIPIAGTLVTPAPSRSILNVSARTVLVDEDCIQNPRGPGC